MSLSQSFRPEVVGPLSTHPAEPTCCARRRRHSCGEPVRGHLEPPRMPPGLTRRHLFVSKWLLFVVFSRPETKSRAERGLHGGSMIQESSEYPPGLLAGVPDEHDGSRPRIHARLSRSAISGVNPNRRRHPVRDRAAGEAVEACRRRTRRTRAVGLPSRAVCTRHPPAGKPRTPRRPCRRPERAAGARSRRPQPRRLARSGPLKPALARHPL
jgi:hypothetical protein